MLIQIVSLFVPLQFNLNCLLKEFGCYWNDVNRWPKLMVTNVSRSFLSLRSETTNCRIISQNWKSIDYSSNCL